MVPFSLHHVIEEKNINKPEATRCPSSFGIRHKQKNLRAPCDKDTQFQRKNKQPGSSICIAAQGTITVFSSSAFPPPTLSLNPHSNIKFLEGAKVVKRNKECCMQSQQKIFGSTYAAQKHCWMKSQKQMPIIPYPIFQCQVLLIYLWSS